MNKRILFSLLIIGMILGLTGCTNAEIKIYQKDENTLSSFSNDNQNTNTTNITDSDTTDTINNTNSNITVENEVISVSSNTLYLENNNILVVSGYNEKGDIVWTYKTEAEPTFEHDSNVLLEDDDINNKVYISNMENIIALDRQTGNIVWKNSENGFVGALANVDIETNRLLVVGGETLNLAILDVDTGKTLDSCFISGMTDFTHAYWLDNNIISVRFYYMYDEELFEKFGLPFNDDLRDYWLCIDLNSRCYYLTDYSDVYGNTFDQEEIEKLNSVEF